MIFKNAYITDVQQNVKKVMKFSINIVGVGSTLYLLFLFIIISQKTRCDIPMLNGKLQLTEIEIT